MLLSAALKSIFYPWAFYFPAQLQRTWASYFVAAFLTGGMGFAGSATAMLVASAIPSYSMANTAYTLVTLITQNLCGFYVELDIIPPWVSWASYLSYYRYAYQAFLRTQTDAAVHSVYSSTYEVVSIFALSSMVYVLALLSHLGAWLSTVLQSQQRASIQLKPAEPPPHPPPIPQHSSTLGPLPNLEVASAARPPAASCRDDSANSEPSSVSSVGVSVRPLEESSPSRPERISRAMDMHRQMSRTVAQRQSRWDEVQDTMVELGNMSRLSWVSSEQSRSSTAKDLTAVYRGQI